MFSKGNVVIYFPLLIDHFLLPPPSTPLCCGLSSHPCLFLSSLYPCISQPGHDAHPSRAGLTRIPISKSLKTGKTMLGVLGMSGGMRAESQSMRIELKKSTISSTTAFQNGGKS